MGLDFIVEVVAKGQCSVYTHKRLVPKLPNLSGSQTYLGHNSLTASSSWLSHVLPSWI